MKRCPTCQQAYTDETVKFYRVDGALLVSDSSNFSESATLTFAQPRATDAEPTELLHRDTSESQGTTSALGTRPGACD